MLDDAAVRRHRSRNGLHSFLLVTAMALLVAACAWTVFGAQAWLWGAGAALLLLLMPRIPIRATMAMYRARPVDLRALPELARIVIALTERARLPAVPALYYVPSATLNAFAVGDREEAAIAVTDGMLRRLTLRELTAVLGHEISHIRNNDLRIMQLADLITRSTHVMSLFGMVLIIVNLPLWLMGEDVVFPWLGAALLYFAPTIASLMQLALSRAREYDADLDGAEITGDPLGLASALTKLERYQGRMWEEMFLPGRRIPEPSLLRTHPSTEERVQRLHELKPARQPVVSAVQMPQGLVELLGSVRRPRHRWGGLWY